MGDGGPKEGRKDVGGAEGRLGQRERGTRGMDRVKGRGSSNVGLAVGKKIEQWCS